MAFADITDNKKLINQSDDEIDLFILAILCWKKKHVFLYSIVLCLIGMFSYTFFVKTIWTAKAYITAPSINDLNELWALKKQYALIFANDSELRDELSTDFSVSLKVSDTEQSFENQLRQLLDLDGKMNTTINRLSKELFDDFILLLTSRDEQRIFLQQNDYILQKLATLKNDISKKRWLNEFINKDLTITEPNNKNSITYYAVQLKSDSSQQSVELLRQFLTAINLKAIELASYEFKDQIQATISDLQQKLRELELNVKIDKEQKIDRLMQAFKIANLAGINDFYSSLERTKDIAPSSAFLLGKKVLASQLENAKKTSVIYPYRYYELLNQLKELQILVNFSVSNTQLFHFELTPQKPMVADGASFYVKLLVAIILGLFIGAIVVSVFHFRQLYNKRTIS